MPYCKECFYMFNFNAEYDELVSRYPVLEANRDQIRLAYDILKKCFAADGFLFTAGNGGSASDADHIVGEMMKGFVLKRPLGDDNKQRILDQGEPEAYELIANLQCGFRAMSLMNQTAIYSAAANDLGADMGPAQQLCSAGRPGDVLWAISTSGNAKNIALACQVAKMRGMKIIGMTGEGGGRLAKLADVCIKAKGDCTFKIQELHLPIYHFLCIAVEKTFFDR